MINSVTDEFRAIVEAYKELTDLCVTWWNRAGLRTGHFMPVPRTHRLARESWTLGVLADE